MDNDPLGLNVVEGDQLGQSEEMVDAVFEATSETIDEVMGEPEQDVPAEEPSPEPEQTKEPTPQIERFQSQCSDMRVEVPMCPNDYLKISDQMNDASHKLSAQQTILADTKETIKEIEANMSYLMRFIQNKTTTKALQGWWVYNWSDDTKTRVCVDPDSVVGNGEIELETVALTASDRQTRFA